MNVPHSRAHPVHTSSGKNCPEETNENLRKFSLKVDSKNRRLHVSDGLLMFGVKEPMD